MTLGCLSCRYSERLESGRVWCEFTRTYPAQRCQFFRYEPGTDEREIEDRNK